MSRTVTLAQLRTDIAAQCDFSTSNTGRYTPTLLNRIINQSIQRFRERISNEGMTHFLVPYSDVLQAGTTGSYAFLALDLSGLNPSLVRTYGIDIQVAGIVRSLVHRPFTERNDFTIGPTMTGQPMAWAHFQTRSVAIMPGPDSTYPYTLWYLPVLADMVSDSDTFDGVAGWEVWVLWDCVCQLIARDQYQAAYQQATVERDLAWTDIVRSSTKVSAAGGAVLGRDSMGAAGLWGRGARREVAASFGGNTVPAANSITNSQLANRTGPIVLGHLDTTSGGVVDVPVPSLTSYLGVFGGSYPGLVPSGTGHATDALRGDGTWGTVSSSGGSGITNAQLAPMPPFTLKGNGNAASGTAQDLTVSQVNALLGVPSLALGGPTGAVQYNGGTGLAGASGMLFSVASGLVLNNYLTMPTGGIRFGGGGQTNSIGGIFAPQKARFIWGDKSDGSVMLELMRWGFDAPDVLTLGGGNTGDTWFKTFAGGQYRWLENNVQRAALNAGQFALAGGQQLGLQQLAHSAAFDKLATVSPSGFVNIATGLQIQASGTLLTVGPSGSAQPGLSASGLTMAGNLNLPSGSVQFQAGSGTGQPTTGLIRFPGESVDVIAGLTAGGGSNARLMTWGSDGTDVLGLGVAVAVNKINYHAAAEHRTSIGANDRQVTNANQLSLLAGMKFGIAQMANSATTDRLAGWTPSGFINVATGIGMGASGMNLSVGTGGPTIHASGISMGGTNDIQSVRRINNVEGMKSFGDLSAASATGIVNVNAGSGTVFHLTASVSQLLSLAPSAVHGDAVLIQNRSAATHAVYNLGTGMGAPSGLLFYLNPSGAAWSRFASGAWELSSRYQYGGF